MIDGLHAAYAGLVAMGRKASVHAHNLANARTEGFRKERIVLETQEEGGVTSRLDEAFSTLPPVEGVPTAESAEVDFGEEIVEQTVAQRAFQANAASLRTNEETLGTLLDILA